MDAGDFALGKTFDVKFTTIASTGAPITLGGTPVISAYPGNSTTEITAGITLTTDFDGRTGMHNIRVVATSGNGYATATDYALVITTGTVDGTSVVGYVVGHFSIENRSALRPTTADRTLDVTATGAAGIDWANVEGQGTTVGLTATTVATVTTTATATNVTTVNGLAAGVITAAAVATGAIDADALAADAGTEIGTAVWATATRTLTAATNVTSTGAAVPITAGGLVSADVTAISTDTVAADNLEAAADGTGYNLGGGAVVAASVTGAVGSVTGNVGGNVTGSVGSVAAGGIAAASFVAGAIDAAAMNVTGSEFTAIPWNAAWDAEVQSEVQDAIEVNNLDHLVKIAVDTNFATTVHLDSVIGHLADAGGTATFDRTTDALEVLGAATAPSAASIADAVWDEATVGHATVGTYGAILGTATDGILSVDVVAWNNTLLTTGTPPDAAGVSAAVWNAATATYGAAGSYGLLVETNLDATVSSRSTLVAGDIVSGGAITTAGGVASANVVQWVGATAPDLNGGGVPAAVVFMDLNVITSAAVSSFASAEIAAAVRTELAVEMGRVDAAVSTRASQASVDTVDTVVDAIKAKTDQLTFTVANQVDANAESVNATTVNGTGVSGDKWRGA